MKPIKNRNHMERVAELPCVVCETDQVQVHHIKGMDFTGGNLRSADWFTFPLCRGCHAYLHEDVKAWEMTWGSQVSHVARTLDTLYGGK
jgi:hypothetical protein